MRELERHFSSHTAPRTRLAIVGRGRLGTALAEALGPGRADALDPRRADAIDVVGPLGRDPQARAAVADADAVLLCVPDAEIGPAAAGITRGPLVGHCSGATALDVLVPHERFLLHPLMTVTPLGARFAGAGAAVAGSSARALALAERVARALQMTAVRVEEADRPAYHAAASVASNFLITLEAMAERLAASAGVDRELLVPLVRATVDNWAQIGARPALTGPVARGDELTVARQRAAVAERTPQLVGLFDALVRATRELAAADRQAAPATTPTPATADRQAAPPTATTPRTADPRPATAPAPAA